MKIAENCVVELDYKLMDLENKVWESSDEDRPWVYLHGYGELMPALEKELVGKGIGQKLKMQLQPEEAYGDYEDELCTQVPLAAFAEVQNLEEGMRLAAEGQDGIHAVTVKSITEDTVTIDANHPLAGQAVRVEVKVLSIREASEEEISHGHVHQQDSCGHTH